MMIFKLLFLCFHVASIRCFHSRNDLTLTQVGTLMNLTTLGTSYNQFGSTPTEIGGLTNLQWVDLSLTAIIPSEMGNWVQLADFDLKVDQSDGAIQTEIGNMNVRYFQLSYNDLYGLILWEFIVCSCLWIVIHSYPSRSCNSNSSSNSSNSDKSSSSCSNSLSGCASTSSSSHSLSSSSTFGDFSGV